MKGGSLERWTGILKVPLNPNNGDGGSIFKVAASVLLSPSSKTLAVPSANAIFFKGDRVEGTGNPVIEWLSESKNIAEILVSKLGASVNAWVVEASTFSGPFAVYREFVPSVNARGEPERYDPNGFPASSIIVSILLKSVDQVCLHRRTGGGMWYLDSGCSRYMTGDRSKFTSLEPRDGGYVTFGDNSKKRIIGIGNAGKSSSTSIEKVLWSQTHFIKYKSILLYRI